ncbi:MAG: DedA family protein, partial [Colwellia sp.]|nr:DedA family protein [Colwellia sp.]
MKLFSAMYEWTLKWAEHKFAPRMLALLSFAESVFFPIPPDVLLAPMVLAKPNKAWQLASLTTIASIVGGVVGYLLGYMMFEPWIQPLITEFGYQGRFDTAMDWFNQWGVWVVFIAGFSPIPYKLFTVSAGFLQMAFLPFLLASAVGRGMRFFLVAGLIQWGGS